MKYEDIPEWLIEQFRGGYAPMDEPPGLEELAYKTWKQHGGKVDKPQTVELATSWAIVDMLGHRRLAGRLTEVERFGGKFLRLDIPDGAGGFSTRLIGAGAVYEISFVSEDVARKAAEIARQTSHPVMAWDWPTDHKTTAGPLLTTGHNGGGEESMDDAGEGWEPERDNGDEPPL